jgi:replicative DNA helicase
MTELEQNVLSCILFSYKKCLPIAQSILTVDDFYEPRHARIYTEILKQDKAGKAVDEITLSEDLRNEGILEEIGGAAYISGIASLMPTTAHIETYCRQLRETSNARKITKVISEAGQSLKDGVDYKDVIDKVMRSIGEIESDKVSQFVDVRDIVNDVYNNIKNGKRHGLNTGFEKVDSVLKGIDKEDFIILAADTGKGKSAMALNIIANVLSEGKIVLEYSLEMSNEQNTSRLLACISETDSRKADSELMPHERERRLKGCGSISTYNFILNAESLTVAEIRATAKAKENELSRLKRHIDFIVVDYAQIIAPGSHAESRQQEVAETGQQLCALAKEIKCPVMLLSQVNGDYQKDKRRLRLGDLRESKALSHPATIVMLLNKDSEDLRDPHYTLEFLKVRHGPLFYSKFEFIPQFTKFIEKEDTANENKN